MYNALVNHFSTQLELDSNSNKLAQLTLLNLINDE